MFWTGFGLGSLVGMAVVFRVVVGIVANQKSPAQSHEDGMELLREGHEIMRQNGAAIERIARALEGRRE